MHGQPNHLARRQLRRRKLPTPEEARQREQARARQRERRERDRDGITTYPGRASPLLIEAVIARSIDSGMTEEEAERASLDRKKVAADMAEVGDAWARLYLAARRK